MSALNVSNQKFRQITLDNRIRIQERLDHGSRLIDIARQISKHPSSVAKEIRSNRSRRLPACYNDAALNNCFHRKTCCRQHVFMQPVLSEIRERYMQELDSFPLTARSLSRPA